MKKLIKTTLLTAASVVISGTSLASTIAVTEQTHSTEGLEGVTAVQASNSIVVTLGAAYAEGDTISFQFNADVMSNTTFPSQLNVPTVDSATPSEAIAGMALGFLSSDTSNVIYRVTSVTQPDDTPGDGGTNYSAQTTLGAVITLGSVGYTATSVTSGDLTMTVASSTNNGGSLDTNSTATLATAKTQFGSATMSAVFDNVIDVSDGRIAFTPAGTDTMSWSITNPATTGWMNLATVNSSNGTVATINGESGKMASLKTSAFAVAGGGTVTFTEASDQVDVSYDGDVTSDTLTFTPPVAPDAVALNVQSFTAGMKYNYTSAGGTENSKTVGSGLSAGAWTLNGSIVTIPYMPYSANASQIIYLTNTGTQSGDILVTAFDLDGNKYDLGVVASSGAGKLVKLANVISTGLAAKGFTAGKLTITITVEVPKADIIVYASYNVGGSDRGFVNTDQYLPEK